MLGFNLFCAAYGSYTVRFVDILADIGRHNAMYFSSDVDIAVPDVAIAFYSTFFAYSGWCHYDMLFFGVVWFGLAWC